jgi:hypothetical protein
MTLTGEQSKAAGRDFLSLLLSLDLRTRQKSVVSPLTTKMLFSAVRSIPLM